MSEHATVVATSAASTVAGGDVSTPEFDRAEINSFGADDTHAVTVIGKMLVGFFFYSLLVMAVVSWLTWHWVSQPNVHPAATHHSEDAEEY